MTIKAIETKYKGYRFRSRLEARWAVFFDTLGIEWEYEKEGYELSTGERYLPDFWLSNVHDRYGTKGIFAEVKGVEATDAEIEKLARLVHELGQKHGAMLHEGIKDHPQSNEFLEVSWQVESNTFGIDNPMVFMKCYKCGAIKYEFYESNYMECDICGEKSDDVHPKIIKAYDAARSARFEFGESG